MSIFRHLKLEIASKWRKIEANNSAGQKLMSQNSLTSTALQKYLRRNCNMVYHGHPGRTMVKNNAGVAR